MATSLAVSVAVGALAFASPSAAQDTLETCKVDASVVSPQASADALDWLVGSWSGPGVGGATATETWARPVGGTMVGTFVQQKADGSILFSELMYIRPVGDSLEIAIKHFNADLTSWEEKDDVERFRLIAIEECAAYFQELTIRCANKNAPHKGIVIAVRAGEGEDGRIKELMFRYRRLDPERSAAGSVCWDAVTTLDLNRCYTNILAKADQRRLEYAYIASQHHRDRPALVVNLQASEKAFELYRKAECDAVYEDWKEGTIREVMSLSCRIAMTDKRTRTVWQNWLTYRDSTRRFCRNLSPAYR